MFPISRDPPEGGTGNYSQDVAGANLIMFPISRDPPEGGTKCKCLYNVSQNITFPISRDPPEGGTFRYDPESIERYVASVSNF